MCSPPCPSAPSHQAFLCRNWWPISLGPWVSWDLSMKYQWGVCCIMWWNLLGVPSLLTQRWQMWSGHIFLWSDQIFLWISVTEQYLKMKRCQTSPPSRTFVPLQGLQQSNITVVWLHLLIHCRGQTVWRKSDGLLPLLTYVDVLSFPYCGWWGRNSSWVFASIHGTHTLHTWSKFDK